MTVAVHTKSKHETYMVWQPSPDILTNHFLLQWQEVATHQSSVNNAK